MQGPDPAGREAALGPFSAILGCLPSAQTAPRTLARDLGKRVWAVLLFPGLWELSGLPVRASLGAEAAVARFCAYLLGGGLGEELSGLGGTLA